MRLLPLGLAALVLLSGCLGVSTSSHSTDVQVGDRHYTKECVNGECEFCMDGECVPCSEEECDDCLESRGDCAAMDRARVAGDARAPDFEAQESHDLATGLPETAWEFDVAPGATGHVHLLVADPATGEASVMASACFRYEVEGRWGSSSGNDGSCGNSVGVSGSTDAAPKVLAWWDDLGAAHYRLSVSAPAQANRLMVDIQVDNP